MQLEERLGNLYGKHEIDQAVSFLNKLIEDGKFSKDTPENRFRFCSKFIMNRRERKASPKDNADKVSVHVAENMFEILEKRHGIEWMKERNSEVNQLKKTNPVVYERIKRDSKISSVYHKYLTSHVCNLDPSERIELEKMCVELISGHGRSLTPEQQAIADKVNQQMDVIEKKGLARAMVCNYVCNHMDNKTIFNDEVEI